MIYLSPGSRLSRLVHLGHCALGLCLLGVVSPAIAAQSATLALEEVIVTATKREARLQDISVAITALSEEIIRESQINSAEELTRLVPSLGVQKGNPRSSSFVIRGIGTQSYSSAVEPSVSTVLDGVVLGRSGQAFMQLLDIERVEVLRGPQGTLFGKNATAGVVNIVTRDPTDTFTGEVMGRLVSEGEYRTGVTLSGPLSSNLGYRLSANGGEIDNFSKNYYDGSGINTSDDWSVRAKLRWDPLDTLELKWTGDTSKRACECTGAIRRLEPYGGNEAQVDDILNSIAPVRPGDENEDVNIDERPHYDWNSWGNSLEVNWELGDYTLTSISAYRGYDIDEFGDTDAQPTNKLGFNQFGASEQTQLTEELRLTSPDEGALTYVLGLFYFDQTVDRSFTRKFELVPGLPGQTIADFSVDSDNWAAFGEATWHLADHWRLTLGARYTEDELSFRFQRTQEGFPPGLPPTVAPFTGGASEEDFSGKIALQWDYSDTGMTYLSYAQGYKGPALDVIFETNPDNLPTVEPETSDAIELGIKTTLFHNRLQLNAALFHATYEEFQAQAYYDPDGPADCPDNNPACDPDNITGGFQLINAGKVTTQGLELDFTALLSERLRVSGGLALIDASIDDYPEGPCSGGQQFRGECPTGLQNLSGGDLPFSAEWKINLSAVYTIPLETGFDVELRALVRAQDDVQYSLTQDPYTVGDAYTIVDASIALRDQGEHWDLTLFTNNLTDEFYPVNINSHFPQFLPNGYLHGFEKNSRRTYGLELRYRW